MRVRLYCPRMGIEPRLNQGWTSYLVGGFKFQICLTISLFLRQWSQAQFVYELTMLGCWDVPKTPVSAKGTRART
jgi:hypothetical protein